MKQLIPLIVGLFVAGVLFFGMQAFVWALLHGGPELRDRFAPVFGVSRSWSFLSSSAS